MNYIAYNMHILSFLNIGKGNTLMTKRLTFNEFLIAQFGNTIQHSIPYKKANTMNPITSLQCISTKEITA